MSSRWIDQDEIKAAIRANDAAASAPEIAAHIGRSTQAVRSNIAVMVKAGRLVELGFTSTGARCYGIHDEKETP